MAGDLVLDEKDGVVEEVWHIEEARRQLERHALAHFGECEYVHHHLTRGRAEG